jgi:TatD DNase family protein
MENIFDTHAHYTDNAFDDDRDILLSRLPSDGVKYIVLASSSVEETVENSELSEKYGYIYTSVGVHPECAGNVPSDYMDVLSDTLKKNRKVLAVGEIGLDCHYDGYDLDKQIKIFREQLEFAKETDLPVIIHSRDACEITLKILKEYKPRGVVHCFGYSAEIAEEIVKLGMYVGFTGVVTFKNAKKSLKAVSVVPNERLLLETDCPYMAPVPERGKRCDSSMIRFTAEKVAEIKGMGVQEVLDMTCRNGMKFYGVGEC